MTRAQVAAHLGISTSGVRRMEGVELFPERADDGTHRFRRGDVEAFLASRASHAGKVNEGELAAEVFRLFEEGRRMSEIVRLTKLAPRRIRYLWNEWSTELDRPAPLTPEETEMKERRTDRAAREHARYMRELDQTFRPERPRHAEP